MHTKQTIYERFFKNTTYFGLDEPLGGLNLGFAESPSVLGAHVCPDRQVGGLLQSLREIETNREFQLQTRDMKTHWAEWFIYGKHAPSALGFREQALEDANKEVTSAKLWLLQGEASGKHEAPSCVIYKWRRSNAGHAFCSSGRVFLEADLKENTFNIYSRANVHWPGKQTCLCRQNGWRKKWSIKWKNKTNKHKKSCKYPEIPNRGLFW